METNPLIPKNPSNSWTGNPAARWKMNAKIGLFVLCSYFDIITLRFGATRDGIPKWKRGADIALTILILPILAPVLLVLATWIKLVSRGPVFFKQERVGYCGKKFLFYKFRSMHIDRGTRVHENHLANLVASNKPMTKLDSLGDPRVIRGGGFLRATGLDELPQIINVIRGEMSFVGPRPCTEKEYTLLYQDDQKHRFDALPGLTGLWQVKGKNRTTFLEMLEMDEFYIDNRCPCLDALIIFRTPAVLFLQCLDLIEMRFCKSGAAAKSQENSDRQN